MIVFVTLWQSEGNGGVARGQYGSTDCHIMIVFVTLWQSEGDGGVAREQYGSTDCQIMIVFVMLWQSEGDGGVAREQYGSTDCHIMIMFVTLWQSEGDGRVARGQREGGTSEESRCHGRGLSPAAAPCHSRRPSGGRPGPRALHCCHLVAELGTVGALRPLWHHHARPAQVVARGLL